jgi:hypothetical protein
MFLIHSNITVGCGAAGFVYVKQDKNFSMKFLGKSNVNQNNFILGHI